MILSGPFYATLLRLALPLIIVEVVSVSYNIVDAYWLGIWGGTTFTVPRLTRPTYMLFEAVFTGLSAANLAMMSQYVGARKYGEAARTFHQYLTVSLSLGIVFTSCYLALNEYLIRYVVQAPKEVIEHVLSYSNMISFDILLNGVTTAFTTAFHSIGETKVPAIAGVSSSLLNFFLDPILITGVGPVTGLGPAGAAIATVISRSFKLTILAVIFMRRFRNIGLRLSRRLERSWIEVSTKAGVPMFLRHALNSLGVMVQYAIVNFFGVVATASYTIGFLFMDMAEAFVRGSTTPIAVMVGQNLGARNSSRAKSIAIRSSALLGGFTAIASTFLLLYRRDLAGFFTNDPLILSESMRFLELFLPTLPFLSLFFVGLSVGRGSGRTVIPTFITLVRMWGLRIVCAYVSSLSLGMGTYGLWVSISLSNLIGGIASILWIAIGNWSKPVV